MPLLDAIAAGEMDLAAQISKEMPIECKYDQGETEEDFYYYQLISSIILEVSNTEKHQNILKNFENALDGDDSIRFNVMKAICEKDSELFVKSLSEFINRLPLIT